MNIRVNRTGSIFYEVDSTLGQLFIEAGLAAQYTPKPKAEVPPLKPEWQIVRLLGSPQEPRIQLKHGSFTSWFSGEPRDAAGHFRKVGHEVPDLIVRQYKRELLQPIGVT